MYLVKKLFILSLFSLVLAACSTVRYSSSGEAEPLLQHPLSENSKILIVSAVNDNFILHQNLSFNHYHLGVSNLDQVISNAVAAQVSQNKPYQVVIKPWPFGQLSEVESGGSKFGREFTSGLSQSLVPGSISLKPEVISQLQSLNSNYHADYLLLITGNGFLTCPDLGRKVSPLSISLQMYLIDAKTNRVLTWHRASGEESKPYSTQDNTALCQEISANQENTPRKLFLKQWMATEAPRLAQEATQALFASEN